MDLWICIVMGLTVLGVLFQWRLGDGTEPFWPRSLPDAAVFIVTLPVMAATGLVLAVTAFAWFALYGVMAAFVVYGIIVLAGWIF